MHSSKLNVLAIAIQSSRDQFVQIPWERASLLAQQYWTISRSRLSLWSHSLWHVSQTLQNPPMELRPLIPPLQRLLEEIILSELHVRVWGGVWACYDHANPNGTADPLGGLGLGLLQTHRELSVRAHELMLDPAVSGRSEWATIDRLARRVHRWTDRLLAPLATSIDVRPFCYDFDRVLQILESQPDSHEAPDLVMLVSGLQAAQLDSGLEGFAKAMNQDLATMMLGCIPLSVLNEVKLNLDTSTLRSDQATWEIDCLLERALCLEHAAATS